MEVYQLDETYFGQQESHWFSGDFSFSDSLSTFSVPLQFHITLAKLRRGATLAMAVASSVTAG